MNLSEYLSSPDALSVGELRKRSGVSCDAQIRQWQHGYANRRPGPAHCVAIERATDGAVTRKDLRPTDWYLIWPELAEHTGQEVSMAPELPQAPASQALAATENVAVEVAHG